MNSDIPLMVKWNRFDVLLTSARRNIILCPSISIYIFFFCRSSSAPIVGFAVLRPVFASRHSLILFGRLFVFIISFGLGARTRELSCLGASISITQYQFVCEPTHFPINDLRFFFSSVFGCVCVCAESSVCVIRPASGGSRVACTTFPFDGEFALHSQCPYWWLRLLGHDARLVDATSPCRIMWSIDAIITIPIIMSALFCQSMLVRLFIVNDVTQRRDRERGGQHGGKE